ncbi:MAG: TonB-dependent receptor domain-containing protein [Opitutaceae bacterium]
MSDASVEESLSRQNNLDYSAVRIDGEKTEAALSALTADQILEAVATRVPTPDLDADAIGGLLQLTSRRAFEQKESTLRASLAASFDPLVGKPLPDATITHGRSFGPSRQFGFLATLEHDDGRDRDEEIELDWDVTPARLRRFEVREIDDESAETNFNGTLDWKLGEKSFAFIRAEAQVATEQVHARSLGYDLPPFVSPPPVSGLLIHDAALRRSVEESRLRNRALTLTAGANYSRAPWLFELRLTHRATRDEVADQRTYDFAQEDLAFLYQRAEPDFPTATSPAGGPPGDTALQLLDELRISRGDERESDNIASFDVTRERPDQPKPVRLKFGGKARLQHTTHDERNDIYEPAGAGLRVSDVPEEPEHEHILSGRYLMEGFPAPDALRKLFETRPDRFARNEAESRGDTDPANFDVRQQIFAAYAMATFPAGATRFVIGARAEHTASRFKGFEVSFDERGQYEGTRPVAASNDYTHLFPGIQVSRALSKTVTVFASWTRSIRRPEYTDIVPARRISRFDRTIEEGNAKLQPALYTNYDGAVEYTYSNDGQLSLELFHREIHNPSLIRRAFLLDGPFAGYERARPENGGPARLQGFQLTWQQGLAALSERLEGLEVEVNHTYERSRQSAEARPGETFALVERPAHELAVLISYERGPWYVSIDFTQTSRTLEAIGEHRGEDVFTPPFESWDITVSREFRKNLRMVLEVENMSATPERACMGEPSRPHRYSLDLREYRLGIKWGL